jgi:hypothetical protein
MSSNLYWEPTQRPKKDLPDALKFALRKRASDGHVEMVMDTNDLQYLYGLRDAGVKGADDLIEAIQKHGEVRVWEQY